MLGLRRSVPGRKRKSVIRRRKQQGQSIAVERAQCEEWRRKMVQDRCMGLNPRLRAVFLS